MSKFLAAILFVVSISRVYSHFTQECRLNTGGAVIQQLTDFNGYSGANYSMEGLFYDPSVNKLYFVNRNDPELYYLDGKTADFNSTKIPNVTYVAAAIPTKGNKNKMTGVADNSLKNLMLHKDSKGNILFIDTIELSVVESDKNYITTVTAVDKKGRLWVDMSTDFSGKGKGELLAVQTDNTVKKVSDTDKFSEGIGFSNDNKFFFHSDSVENVVRKYKFNLNSGEISEPEIVFNLTKDLNMGKSRICSMEVVKNNDLWLGLCEIGMIVYYSPKTNSCKQLYNLPAKYPVSLEMGGPDMDVLFVGTHNLHLEHDTRAAGNVFAIVGTGVKGVESFKMQK